MSAVDDVDKLIEQWQLAGYEFVKGNPESAQKLFSHREDVSLNNPFGPPARGWEQVVQAMEVGASQYREGEVTGFEIVAKCVSAELAYIVWVERTNAKIGGREDIAPFDLRVTMIFRPEDGVWKVVHRDSITTSQPVESVIQK